MKLHSTNYTNTFIKIAEDCPAVKAEIPPVKGDAKTAANIQFDMVYHHPYKYTSDDVLFEVFAIKNELKKSEHKKERETFFSKGQPCFRASPLTKRYGWGVHYNQEGKMALVPLESAAYKKLTNDTNLAILKAMKSTK